MGYGIEQGLNGWQDPRTGLWFATEAVAISLGYGKPVDVDNTIVQVGSQGSYTKDGRLVTTADLVAPGADNSGYVGLAATNLLNTPSNDAIYASDWISSYTKSLENAGVHLSTSAEAIGDRPIISSPQLVEVWKNVPLLQPSALVQYNTPASSPGSDAEPPSTSMISTGNTVGTQDGTGTAGKIGDAVKSYGVLILGAVVVIAVLVLFGKSMSSGASA